MKNNWLKAKNPKVLEMFCFKCNSFHYKKQLFLVNEKSNPGSLFLREILPVSRIVSFLRNGFTEFINLFTASIVTHTTAVIKNEAELMISILTDLQRKRNEYSIQSLKFLRIFQRWSQINEP